MTKVQATSASALPWRWRPSTLPGSRRLLARPRRPASRSGCSAVWVYVGKGGDAREVMGRRRSNAGFGGFGTVGPQDRNCKKRALHDPILTEPCPLASSTRHTSPDFTQRRDLHTVAGGAKPVPFVKIKLNWSNSSWSGALSLDDLAAAGQQFAVKLKAPVSRGLDDLRRPNSPSRAAWSSQARPNTLFTLHSVDTATKLSRVQPGLVHAELAQI